VAIFNSPLLAVAPELRPIFEDDRVDVALRLEAVTPLHAVMTEHVSTVSIANVV
jgi:hypothetical protein